MPGQPELAEPLTLTPEDFQQIEAWIEKGHEALNKVLTQEVRRMVPGWVKDLRHRWPARRRSDARYLRAFERGLRERWDAPLSLLEFQILVCRETGEEIITSTLAPSASATPALLSVLTRRGGPRVYQILKTTPAVT